MSLHPGSLRLLRTKRTAHLKRRNKSKDDLDQRLYKPQDGSASDEKENRNRGAYASGV
jgi:hypothetical protein